MANQWTERDSVKNKANPDSTCPKKSITMSNELSKSMKRKLRDFAAKVYEIEMRTHLSELARSFNEWNAGKLDLFQLDNLIHKYHNEKSREFYKAYTGLDPKMFIARAVGFGIIKQEEIPDEFREYIMKLVEILKE